MLQLWIIVDSRQENLFGMVVTELLNKNFLTRTSIPKKYWINPLIVFNGNRITYAMVIS